jgi:Lar family restriction alleviation protein
MMDTIPEEPKPQLSCPFCAGTRVFASQITDEKGMSGPFQIECPCGAAGPRHDSLHEAIKLWNIRGVARSRKRA